MRDNAFINMLVFFTLILLGYGAAYFMDRTPPAPATAPAEASAQAVLGPVPSFSFRDIKGESHAIEDFRGKIIVLNFWASWCAPCVKEFPALLRLVQAYPKRAVLIALSADFNDAALKNFLKRQSATGSNVLVARDAEDVAGKIFKTFAFPETYIIDRDGRIREKIIGGNWNSENLIALIRKL